MKRINVGVSLITLSLVMLGCSSTKISNLVVPEGSQNAIVATKKKMPLTEEQKQNWGHYDLVKDSIPGMSVDMAYEFLANKKGETVVVAVVDSGTDLEHEDLKPNAWQNPKEKPGNKKDDDKNGYVDDINGWNFLGEIYKENAELYRIIKDPSLVDDETYKKAKEAYDEKVKKAKQLKFQYENILHAVKNADETISKQLNKKDYSEKDVENIQADTQDLQRAVSIAKQMYGFGLSSLQEAIDELTKLVEENTMLLSGDTIKKDYRSVLGDDENTMETKFYGDANSGHHVKSESHGTHVSGIIGASRDNNLGMKGVATNVKIMALRVVPDGDEYDKDVALGIRYAVDNGAKVINTSFGKGYSPKSEWVYEAIKYAAEKDVLIVNAAGNDSKNIDEKVTYPNDAPDLVNEISNNFITVGAISSNYDENLVAGFSNYGKLNVDVFAPGVEIYSTTPENEYAFKGGTSMASPAVAGVAALIRSYYPKLTAAQVKKILMNSGSKLDLDVIKPGSASQTNPNGTKVPFTELSVTGRIVNAYNALRMADALVNKKK